LKKITHILYAFVDRPYENTEKNLLIFNNSTNTRVIHLKKKNLGGSQSDCIFLHNLLFKFIFLNNNIFQRNRFKFVNAVRCSTLSALSLVDNFQHTAFFGGTTTRFLTSGIYYYIKVVIREISSYESSVDSSPPKVGIIKLVKHYLDININLSIFDILELLMQKTHIIKKKKKYKTILFSQRLNLNNSVERVLPQMSALSFFVKLLKDKLRDSSNIRLKLVEELKHILRFDKHELYENIYAYDFSVAQNVKPFKYFI
jgi:hypothetical protein